MMNFMIFVPVITVLTIGPAAAKHEISGRIYNGQDAVRGQFKYMAAVVAYEYNPTLKRETCGGAIIRPKWVLTAAHCVDRKEWATIYLGAVDRQEAEIEYEVEEDDIIVNPNWNRELVQNDIALIRIPTTEECDNIAFVGLPIRWINHPLDMFTDMIAIGIGWGKKGDSGPLPNLLQWAEMKIISNEECNQIFLDIVEKDLCVSTAKPYGSTCVGDSGGPLVLRNTGELIGISSSIPDDSCELGDPAVFMRITSYLPWIIAVTGIRL